MFLFCYVFFDCGLNLENMVGLEHMNEKKRIFAGYFPWRKITINVGKNLRPLSQCNADIVSSNAFCFAFISFKFLSYVIIYYDALFLTYIEAFYISRLFYACLSWV